LAVAKLLTQRAQERQPHWAHSDHRPRKRPNHMEPVTGTDLTGVDVESVPAVGPAGPPQS
jgi:hypothetical protein